MSGSLFEGMDLVVRAGELVMETGVTRVDP